MFRPKGQALSSFDTAITELVFTLTKGGVTVSRSVPVDADEITATFEGLAIGQWRIDVVGKNQAGHAVCAASSVFIVKANEISSVTLEMSLITGSLHITVEFDSRLGIVSGTVALLNPVVGSVRHDLEMSSNSGSALFSDIAAMTWPIEIELRRSDGSLALEGDTQVTVNPNETTFARIIFENGSLRVEVTWTLPPSAPTGVHAYLEGKRVHLSWNPNTLSESAVGYLIYRSKGELEPLSLLSDSLVHATTYEDASATASRPYWYSVQAYNADGLSSGLSRRVVAASQNVAFKSTCAIGRWVPNSWQLSFAASPPAGRSIVSGAVLTQTGIPRPMYPHEDGTDSWSAWWNTSEPEPGTYRQTVDYDSGEFGILSFDISLDMFTGIQCPGLVAPSDGASVRTLNPMLKYQVPAAVDRVYVGLRQANAGKTAWLGPYAPGSSSTQVPDGILARGNEYKWRVTCVTDHPTGIHMQGNSDEWRFTVVESE
jgi:hypothetical protein